MVLLLCCAIQVNANNNESSYTGLWITEDDETIVNIIQCNETLCGRIEGFVAKENKNQNSTSSVIKDDEISLQQLKIACSTNILGGFKSKKNQWEKGWIKDFEENKVYSADLKLLKNNQLEVIAYQGNKIFGLSLIWKRIEEIQISCQSIINGY